MRYTSKGNVNGWRTHRPYRPTVLYTGRQPARVWPALVILGIVLFIIWAGATA